MLTKYIFKFTILFLFILGVSLALPSNANAQSCTGSASCCQSWNQVCPSGCTPGDPGCNCVRGSCARRYNMSCADMLYPSCDTLPNIPTQCQGDYQINCSGPTPTDPPVGCINNGICEADEAACPDCTGSGGGGGGGGGGVPGTCGSCDTCGQPANRCSINPTTGVCEAPGYCGPAVSSCSATLSGPNVIQAGASGYFTAYGAGTPDDWFHVWTGDAYWHGTYNPGSGSGPNAATTYTPYTTAPVGASFPFATNVQINIHEGDWTDPDIACTAYKLISITAPAASCSVTVPNVILTAGTSSTISPTINIASGSVTDVNFNSLNTAIASISPNSTSTSPYPALITGVATGNTIYAATVNMSDGSSCTDTSSITVTPPGPWWQATGGDTMTNQSLNSTIPSTYKFLVGGAGGFPGNALYGTSSNLTTTNVSSKGWLGKSIYRGKIYDYNYFNKLLTGRVTFNTLPALASQATLDSGTVSSDGYYYFKKDAGTLNINSDIVISNKKIVILSEGTTHLNGNISITTVGQGFLMVISKEDIRVASSVTTLSGIFATDTDFNTGSSATALNVKGTVVAWGDVNLQRNLGAANATTPSETFTFDPALTLLFPRSLVRDSVDWKEVAP